jgi:hypothetical protein
MKDCCPAMTLVLSRVRMSDRLGIMREQLLVFKTGRFVTKIVARMHSSAKDLGSFIELNYCPFCGKRVNNARAKKATAGDTVDTIRGEQLTPGVSPGGDNTTHRTHRNGKSAPVRNRR